MVKCMTYAFTKAQIDTIEEAVKKSGSEYFGDGPVRYESNITDNGLLEKNVDDLFQSIPPKAWLEVKKTLSTLEDDIQAGKVIQGELTKKPEDQRLIYKEPTKKSI